MGLNDSYLAIRGQIPLYEPLPDINEVLSLILQEEKQRSFKNGDFNGSAMAHPIEATTLYSSTNSGSKNNHRGKGNSKKEGPICTYCGKIGHIADKCYRLDSFRPGFKFKNKSLANQVSCNQMPSLGNHFNIQTAEDPVLTFPQCPISKSQCEQLLAFLNSQTVNEHSSSHIVYPQAATVTTVGPSSSQPLALSSSTFNYLNNFSGKAFCSSSFLLPNSTIFTARVVNRSAFTNTNWIIDTGATNHIVHSISMFSSFTCVSNTYVYLPNGERALVTHVGTVHLTKKLILTNVLCVPSFTFNLISVSHLNKSLTCCLIFLGSFCFIQDLALWSTIGLGREQNGLYLLDNKFKMLSLVPAPASLYQSICTQPNLWHFRLGHPSSGKLDLLNKVMPFVQCNKTAHCDICPIAKQKRFPFTSSTNVSKFRFALIHCDLWVHFLFPQCMVIDTFSQLLMIFLDAFGFIC